MKKISLIVNVYIDSTPELENPFDHPTSLDRFEKENTFSKFYESINKLNIPADCEIDLYLFAIAANNDCSRDSEIKKKIQSVVKDADYKVFIITNSDILKLKKEGNTFLSVDGYCEIRNLGFIFAYHNNSDYLIQFDDDEIIPENYLLKMIEEYNSNPDMYSLNSLYEKDGTVTVDDSSDFDSWKKLSFMNEDFNRLSKLKKPVESIFGLGGNMTFKREYFSKICYPEKVRRGEDFALLLAARLIYANGNELCDISAGNNAFVSYFTSAEEVIIAHRPPEGGHGKKHKLKNDFVRFAMQKAFLKNHLSLDEVYSLSRYVYRMLSIEDYMTFVNSVYKEAAEKDSNLYTDEFVNSEVSDIQKLLTELDKRDLFAEYKEYQTEYIKSLNINLIDVTGYLSC
jgi:hypothetical protein